MSTTGILPRQDLRRLVDEGRVRSRYTLEDHQFQPSSLDLRLGEVAYRVRCSFLPNDEPVQAKLDEYGMYEVDLRDGAVLERGAVYVVPLLESVDLPDDLWARGNPRSSTGRVDVFTRLLTDRSPRFDEVPKGYSGGLYAEVFSRSYTLRVQTGTRLGQLRVVRGRSSCDDQAVRDLHAETPVLFDPAGPRGGPELPVFDGLYLTVSMAGFEGSDHCGYRARPNAPVLDVTKKAHYRIQDFWEAIHPDRRGRLVLDPEDFYLLRSRERVRLPPSHAAEMVAYEPGAGELRSHYAGFFDPGFGCRERGDDDGTVAVMEVRAHDAPFVIEDGQVLCKLQLERMAEAPDVAYGAAQLGSAYQGQGLTPSRHFKPWGAPEADEG